MHTLRTWAAGGSLLLVTAGAVIGYELTRGPASSARFVVMPSVGRDGPGA